MLEQAGLEVTEALGLSEAERARGEVVVIDAGSEAAPIAEMDGPPVVLLTDDADAARQSELWPSRIRAVLATEASGQEIAIAVQAAAAGFVLLRPEEASRSAAARPALAGGEGLTPRESEVLQMVAAGESNKRIAWRLGISEHTVKFHVASILSKLAAGSRAEAVTAGIRRGLIYL